MEPAVEIRSKHVIGQLELHKKTSKVTDILREEASLLFRN